MALMWGVLMAAGGTLGGLGVAGTIPLRFSLIGIAAVCFAVSVSLLGLALSTRVPAHLGDNWLRVLAVVKKLAIGR